MRMTLVTASAAAILAAGTWVLASRAETQNAAQPQRGAQICVLHVSGMTCGGCAAAVKMAAKQVDGVTDADVSLETFDPVVHRRYTIERVLEHGEEEHVAWLVRVFSTDQIQDVLRGRREAIH